MSFFSVKTHVTCYNPFQYFSLNRAGNMIDRGLVLIVGDNNQTIRNLGRVLRDAEYEVAVAMDDLHAFELADTSLSEILCKWSDYAYYTKVIRSGNIIDI